MNEEVRDLSNEVSFFFKTAASNDSMLLPFFDFDAFCKTERR